mgnify:CR=1 FL=1
MDYFKVFLEAYSEHHDRKLKLLEGKELDPEAEKLATQAVTNAKGKKWVNVKDAPITTPSNKQLWVWETAAGKISYNTNPVPWPGAKGIDTPKKWSAFVAAFTATGEQERTALIDDEERLPVPIQDRIKNISEETKTKVANNFFHVEKQIVAVWDKLPEEIKSSYKSIEYFRNYFLGASFQSFENKLLSPKFTLELNNGEWASKPYELNEAQMSLISDSFKDLVDLVATGDGTNCDKNKKVLSNFSKSQNNDVIVRPQGDPNNVDALAFEDKTNFLKNLLTIAEDQCEGIQVDTDEITEPPPLKNNSNNIRGTGFEDYELITSLEKIKKGLMALGKPTTHIDTLIAKKSKELAAKMSKLEEMAEKVWLPEGIISALDPGVRQQTFDLASLVILPPQQPHSIVRSPTLDRIESHRAAKSKLLHQMAKYGRSIRRPIVSLPVGDQTKDGKRQDTVEFYKTEDEAKEAAARDGLVVEPDQGTVEDFFPQKSKEVLKALKADGVFKDDQIVWRLKVSLKSYMSLDHAKYGGGRDSTLREVFTPNGKNEEQIATIKSNLGMDDASFEGVKGYAKEIAAISTTLDGAKVANTVIRNKKSTKVNTGTLVAETLLKKIKQDGNYKDLLSKGVHAEIINACETLVGDSTGQFTPAEKEGALSRIKILVKDRMQASRVRQDLASDKPEIKLKAQQYLAVKMFHAGGSDDDELICDYRGLGSKDNYIFKQNDPLRDAWASVRAGDGKWNLSMTQAGKVVLESKRMTDKDGKEVKGNYPMRITMSSSVRSSKEKDRKPGDPASGYHSGYIVEVDRDTMEHYSRNSSKHLPEASEIVFLFGKLQSLMEKVTGRRL